MSYYDQSVTSSGAAVVETLTGNVGGAVSPTGGNINTVGTSQRASALGSSTDGGGVLVTGVPASHTLTATYESFGGNNVFLGVGAGNNTLTVLNAIQNVGIGVNALNDLTTANECVSVGYNAGSHITSGAKNTALGALALSTVTTATNNTAIGDLALTISTGANNTALGCEVLDTLVDGTDNIAIGNQAGSSYTGSESSNILIGNAGVLGESNVCRIGTEGSGAGQIVEMYLAGNVNTTQIITSGISGSGQFNFTRNNSGSNYNFIFENSDISNAASGTSLDVITGGASAGDPFVLFQVAGVTSWSVGIDNSDSDTFKVSKNGSLGTNDYFSITTGQTINLNAGQVVKSRTVTAASDTAAATDYVLACNRAGAIALALMASPETGRTFRVKDISGAAAANNITITPAAGNIDGAASYVINTNYGSIDLVYTGSEWSTF